MKKFLSTLFIFTWVFQAQAQILPGSTGLLECQIEGSPGDVCEGEEVTLTATFQNPTNYSFFPDRLTFAIVPDDASMRFAGSIPFTIEFWVRVVDNAPTYQNILSKVSNFSGINGYTIGQLDDYIVATMGDGTNVVTVNGNTNVRDNQWHHIAVIFDPNDNLILYVDGTIDAQASLAGLGPINPTEPLSMGSAYAAGQAIGFFSGYMDEVRIWNERRTPAQLQNRRFNHFNPAGVTGLVANFDFNEGGGTQAFDCANGFIATMSAAAWATSAPNLSWTFPITWSDGVSLFTNVFQPLDTTYLFAVIGYCKYICMDSIIVNVIDCAGGISDITKLSLIWVPNAFSPNEDTKNDEWSVRGVNISDYHVTVFNRMGNKVFESENVDKAWNGESPDGTIHEGIYTYVIRYLDNNNERKTKYGTITLMK